MCLSILREHSIADKAEAIRQTRRVATGILVALTLIFIATLFVDQPGWPVLLLRAIAEAGMIGGLADWFAVEALFRRPLGLPIPHTALLPTNKDRVARSVGQFFTEHFLDPETARARVLRMEPALHTALQLSSKENALALSRYIVRAIDVLTRNANDIRTTRAIGARLREAVIGATSDAKLAKHIGNVMRASVGHDVTNRLLAFSRERFDSNRAGIEAFLLGMGEVGDKAQVVAQGVPFGQLLQPPCTRQKQVGGRQPQFGNTAGRRFDLAGLQEGGGHLCYACPCVMKSSLITCRSSRGTRRGDAASPRRPTPCRASSPGPFP